MANFTELDRYLFGQATHYDIYRKLGAHFAEVKGVKGVYFDLWAPNAERVFLIGSFNGWNETANEMTRLKPETMGIYELFIPGLKEGELYKYLIETKDGKRLYKADPYANYAELRPGTASAIADIEHFKWTDSKWMENRKKEEDVYAQPMAIYEVHPGSWKRHPGRDDEGFYSYRDLVTYLIPYVKEMGYTHIELMGISEYPFDGSWGYQVTGYYAPTSRYGKPEDFAYFINECHKNKIGVILDWVPAHFPKDAHGLAEFDGTCLYEYADPRMGEHPDWGTKIFDYGKNEVKNFLIGSALMWVEHYHIDGLRVDAVASMLYLDYGKEEGQWVRNKYGDNKNLEAIEFLRNTNRILGEQTPGAVTMAEESTDFAGVTRPPAGGGLGFWFKWNLGWMHDTLDYMKLDPVHRRYHHDKMTFGMLYNYTENFVLPLSHDEVVHGKKSILDRMPGDAWQKFANLRAYYGWLFAFPGKKLLFMGNEFAQGREWNHDVSLDWHLLEGGDNWHHGVQRLVRDLNHTYRHHKALHELDFDPYGFEWLVVDDHERSVFVFVRRDRAGNEIIVASNFTPVPRHDYRFGINQPGRWREALNTDSMHYHGSNQGNGGVVESDAIASHGREHSLSLTLPPLATIWLVREAQ